MTSPSVYQHTYLSFEPSHLSTLPPPPQTSSSPNSRTEFDCCLPSPSQKLDQRQRRSADLHGYTYPMEPKTSSNQRVQQGISLQHEASRQRSVSEHLLKFRRSSVEGLDDSAQMQKMSSHRRTTSDIAPMHHHSTFRKTPSSVPPNTSITNNNSMNRYRCNQCQKTFSRPSSLRIHILSHTGEKPHICPHSGCGKRFSVQSNMRRHLKVHYCNAPSAFQL
ncbi:hypothetical protein BD560DRAFT_406505 [Blakeslea trispora]|nr:hypothetical protein BD560DRAFT_406505 [Blakeslea trispora]